MQNGSETWILILSKAEKWHHLCFKDVILISHLQNQRNQILQYSQTLTGGVFRAATIDTIQLENVRFIKEAE